MLRNRSASVLEMIHRAAMRKIEDDAFRVGPIRVGLGRMKEVKHA